MSGKPASVGAPRAGAPRVLVYVADARPLEAGSAGPEPPPPAPAPPRPGTYTPPAPIPAQHNLLLNRNTHYRTQIEQNNQRKLPNTIFYKSVNDNDSKLSAYGSAENTIVQRTGYFPASQQFFKETAGTVEEDKGVERPVSAKNNHFNQFNSQFGDIDNYRIPTDSGEASTYQGRCNGTAPESVMPSMQTLGINQGHNQFDGCMVQSDATNCSDRDLVAKSYMNYQVLEQSDSHQSIVNQSISLLNQQVGVNRGVVSEGEGTSPQLVQTADGVVLAVLPSTVLPQPSEATDLASRIIVPSDSPKTITVPLGWRRVINGNTVLYISPSGTALSTLPQLRDYLQTTGTCKCGLPCPLRPETTFSFDPKVASKPYQPVSGAELTKLCNHKRKLLATLQARAQSPATPPPTENKKVTGTEVGIKKKMKKRPGFPPNMSVSPMMVQRDRSLGDFKSQDNDINRTTISPGVGIRNNQNCLPTFAPVHHMPQDFEVKQEPQIPQRSSHYLTVSSGWITQQENLDQKPIQSLAGSSNTLSVGMPVLGTNGQIIGVNTSYNKQLNIKNSVNIHGHQMSLNSGDHEQKEEKKDSSSKPAAQIMKPSKEEESQIFCGLNQPLTPEVMQKINEQQQIFIQQNQKQIEMAMKGFRTQLAENMNKPTQNQYVPQAQLVIQNGAVVKTNPAKTPPWQVKRNDCNAVAAPSPKPYKLDNMDGFDDPTNNMSEDSSGSYSPFPSSEQQMNQAMCTRVPPLPQHYNMMGQQWPPFDMNKKKMKTNNKPGRKKASPSENKFMNFGNQGVRYQVPDGKINNEDNMPNNNLPSFMEDPSGYLAQQTVLLNNTISKQVGMNQSFDGNQFENPSCCFGQPNQGKTMPRSCEGSGGYRGNMVPNPSPSPNHTPDSSVLSEKGPDQCCKGCNVPMKNSQDYAENQIRLKYMKQNVYKLELDGTGTNSSPRHGFDDNPVTSSTFVDRSPMMNENCGPIQAGTVSTSNVSPPETLQPPEPSPTFSNSSRSTDTPHSSGSNSNQMLPNCSFPSPAYSNPGSCKDSFSNPSTPGGSHFYPYNSPGPPNNMVTGTQMMHFISNHNVNKNLMEVDNISMVGVKPAMKTPAEAFRSENRRRIENAMPGYCPPPHLGPGPAHSLIQACYVQTFVTTMASGFSVTRDTVTSVLAGRANTATTSINASQANFVRPPPPASVNLATTYAIPNNQPDPFINSVNLPTSYPLHIAGTTAQNMISKMPLEIAQAMGSVPSKPESNNTLTPAQPGRKSGHTTPGQILISSTGQIIVSSNQMPPPPPKITTSISSMQGSSVTNAPTSVTQVVPAAGGVQPIVNQSAVVVNALSAPFVIQQPMMAVDGQVVQQNTVLPQIVTGVVSGQSPNESPRQIEVKNGQNFLQGLAMLSPESMKKRSKKKKGQTSNITNVLQITAPQQNSNSIMVHSSPQQNSSPQFSPRGFQLSPNNISPTPMLQALTIVPGKSGTPAHIVMNGQGSTNNFGSQSIITNTSPSQQINLLQPVNLINNGSGVVQNFGPFQQFIVPNLGGVVMTAEGALLQDGAGVGVQLQLQTLGGQNVLAPVQNFASGANGGVVLRTQNQQGKMIQSQHSPGAQFLSPNSQVMMNSPNFNGQLSPLLANLSPTNVTFNTSPPQIRSGNVQTQEFIQTNQMGQTLMVPLSPKQVALSSASTSRSNSTFVQQNTTIVQQQTTLVSNSHNAQLSSISTNIQAGNPARLSIDPNVLLSKQINVQKRFIEVPVENPVEEKEKSIMNQIEGVKLDNPEGYMKFMNEFGPMLSGHVRHSVSTQTLAQQQRNAAGGKSPSGQTASGSSCSPPDTTTHSPLGAEGAASPRLYAARTLATQPNYADTTTKSPEPSDANSSAMVQCVSSSEQDMAEAREVATSASSGAGAGAGAGQTVGAGWPRPHASLDRHSDSEHNMMSNMPMMRQNRTPSQLESPDMHYTQNMGSTLLNNQHMMPVSSNYYDRQQTYKRKNDFGDGSTYRNDKIMRTNNEMVHGMPTDDFDSLLMGPDKNTVRHFAASGSNSDGAMKVFDRHNLGSGDDTAAECVERVKSSSEQFEVGQLVWGPVKGYASWPGKLQARGEGGRWLVRWFGERAPTLVDHSRLLTLTEGLEAHHAARTKHRKSRKLNTLLENAIQEAMAELDKKTEKTNDDQQPSTSEEITDNAPIGDTPKRKKYKVRKEKHHKKKPAATASKVGESSRLRSSR